MAVYKLAKQEGNKKYSILGGILIPITIAFLVFLILPMFSGNVLAPETYALMIAWSIIGLIYFNHIIRKDHTRKFGKAILVWVSLLAFVVILSLTWSQRMNEARENAVIKDISFIRNAFGETRDVRMIELIIDIADYLHVPVVAEGVETEEQYMALKALGCDYVQGYYFSRPVPPADFDRFLIERGEQGVEIAPAVKRTYVSISKALTSDYENIYFVDVVSNHYLEFFSVKNGDLENTAGRNGLLRRGEGYDSGRCFRG